MRWFTLFTFVQFAENQNVCLLNFSCKKNLQKKRLFREQI